MVGPEYVSRAVAEFAAGLTSNGVRSLTLASLECGCGRLFVQHKRLTQPGDDHKKNNDLASDGIKNKLKNTLVLICHKQRGR